MMELKKELLLYALIAIGSQFAVTLWLEQTLLFGNIVAIVLISIVLLKWRKEKAQKKV